MSKELPVYYPYKNSWGKCSQHPKYSGKYRPRANCQVCWVIWFRRHEDIQCWAEHITKPKNGARPCEF